MEYSLYSIGNLKSMEVIDINSGAKLGYIKDIKIDCSNYNVISFLLPSQRVSWFGKNESIEIPWDKIKKIGVDVILVDGSNMVAGTR